MSTTPASPPPTGRFTYDAPTGKWDWDDEVFRIHGLEPGSVTPSTELVLRHCSAADQVDQLLRASSRTGSPFSTSYRLEAADDTARQVVMVGEAGVCDEEGNATIEGYYVDLTIEFAERGNEVAQEAVAASAANRAEIEQAKGVLMLAYGLDPDQAFAMLQWWSRNRNIKVRDLSGRLVALLAGGGLSDVAVRSGIDGLLHDIST